MRAPPKNLQAKRFAVGDDEWVVFSWEDTDIAEAIPFAISEVEREIITHLMTGASNKDIASRRGKSVRTVANQIATLLKRFGVDSRYALVAHLRSLALQKRARS